uniref:U11/U12 small nuclear ribonucleoprotein 35 kDa protein isoform X2 n=1 Tax=Rhizophora mucronata TaxID=61149 RepID=A0A2P2MB68_RHIMU
MTVLAHSLAKRFFRCEMREAGGKNGAVWIAKQFGVAGGVIGRKLEIVKLKNIIIKCNKRKLKKKNQKKKNPPLLERPSFTVQTMID